MLFLHFGALLNVVATNEGNPMVVLPNLFVNIC